MVRHDPGAGAGTNPCSSHDAICCCSQGSIYFIIVTMLFHFALFCLWPLHVITDFDCLCLQPTPLSFADRHLHCRRLFIVATVSLSHQITLVNVSEHSLFAKSHLFIVASVSLSQHITLVIVFEHSLFAKSHVSPTATQHGKLSTLRHV